MLKLLYFLIGVSLVLSKEHDYSEKRITLLEYNTLEKENRFPLVDHNQSKLYHSKVDMFGTTVLPPPGRGYPTLHSQQQWITLILIPVIGVYRLLI